MNKSGTAPPLPSDDLTAFTQAMVVGFTANASVPSAAFCFAYQKVYNATVALDVRSRSIDKPANLKYIPDHPLESYVVSGCVSRMSNRFALRGSTRALRWF